MTRFSRSLPLVLALFLGACASDDSSPRPQDGSPGDGDGDGAPGDGDGDGTPADGAPGDGDGSSGDGDADGSDGTPGDGDGDGDGSQAEGVIEPSVGHDALLSATKRAYEAWKSAYLEEACTSGQMRVHSAPDTDDYTVSEAHGYGMLFTVLMAAEDPTAHASFDALFAYYDAHPSEITDHLMAWAQGENCRDVEGANAATDGDLDIAYALLLADTTWGSSGSVDYAAEADQLLGAILEGEIASANYPLVGDWVSDGDHARGTRASDFLGSHFKAFAAASGDARWTSVDDKIYAIVSAIQSSHSSSGLLPDFIDDANTDAPVPAPADWLEGRHDGDYHYNACRVPWRLTSDYVLSGDDRPRAAVRKMNAFIREATGDDPEGIVDGFTLDGSAYGRYAGFSFVAPFMVSAMIEPESGSNQAWLDSLWTWVSEAESEGYYGDSIRLASMMVASGIWRAP